MYVYFSFFSLNCASLKNLLKKLKKKEESWVVSVDCLIQSLYTQLNGLHRKRWTKKEAELIKYFKLTTQNTSREWDFVVVVFVLPVFNLLNRNKQQKT